MTTWKPIMIPALAGMAMGSTYLAVAIWAVEMAPIWMRALSGTCGIFLLIFSTINYAATLYFANVL